MSATIIDGKAIAQEVRAKIATAAAALSKEHGIVPGLAVVLVAAIRRAKFMCARNRKR